MGEGERALDKNVPSRLIFARAVVAESERCVEDKNPIRDLTQSTKNP